MKKDAKIYIAGHQGLVGSALMRCFTAAGYTNLVTRTFAELDLRRQADVEQFFEAERPEYVVLAAAKVGGILANSTYKAEFIYDNIMIASNVIHSAYKFAVTRLINLGSSCIYPKNAPQPLKEEYLLTGSLEETNEPYAIAKIAAIKLCRYYNEQYGTQFISLMPTNLYGPHDNFNLETSHVLPALLRKFYLAKLLADGDLEAVHDDIARTPLGWGLEKKITSQESIIALLASIGVTAKKVHIWGSGEAYREFMYVDDLAAAVLHIFSTSDMHFAGQADYLFNVGTGVDITIKGLALLLAQALEFQDEIVFDESKPIGVSKKLLDTNVLATLDWRAQYSLQDGICKTLAYYKKFTFSLNKTQEYLCKSI